MAQHDRLDGLSKDVLIDANVLLEASFVGGGGLVRTAVERLRPLGFNPLVSIETIEEADRRLLILSQELKLPYRPVASFHQQLFADFRVEVVEKVRKSLAKPLADLVSRADAYLVHAAIAHNAWVLTNELPLPAALLGSPVAVRSCWEVVLANVRDAPPDRYLFRVAPRRADGGFFFARVRIRPPTGRHTIVEDPDLGWLYLDQDRSELAFETLSGTTYRAPLGGRPDEMRPVAFSFKRTPKGDTVTLRAETTRTSTLKEPLPVPSSQGYGLFHRRNGLDHFHGHISMISIGPGAMTSKTWRNLMLLPDWAPNPITSDVLATALLLARQKPDGLYVASEQAVLRARYW